MESDVEIYDSEILVIQSIGHYLEQKYSTRSATRANLLSLVHEAEDLFRKAGFEIVIGLPKHLYREVFGLELADPDGTLPDKFEIRIVKRLTEFDPERQHREVQEGVADDFWEKQRKKQQQRGKG